MLTENSQFLGHLLHHHLVGFLPTFLKVSLFVLYSPNLFTLILETPWNLGCTPVDVHDELSITLTEELLDYVAQNPCKNILQGMV